MVFSLFSFSPSTCFFLLSPPPLSLSLTHFHFLFRSFPSSLISFLDSPPLPSPPEYFPRRSSHIFASLSSLGDERLTFTKQCQLPLTTSSGSKRKHFRSFCLIFFFLLLLLLLFIFSLCTRALARACMCVEERERWKISFLSFSFFFELFRQPVRMGRNEQFAPFVRSRDWWRPLDRRICCACATHWPRRPTLSLRLNKPARAHVDHRFSLRIKKIKLKDNFVNRTQKERKKERNSWVNKTNLVFSSVFESESTNRNERREKYVKIFFKLGVTEN